EQGIMGIMVPEDFGGLGLSLLDAAVAAEALGYHATPTPFAAALVMAPLALIASGDRAQQKAWLPRIASGEVRIGVGFAGMSGQTGEAAVRLAGNMLSGCVTG
ncbi:acyl-CoA dehydrogenase family protein, partial [Pandoraea nosoerga]|nr:acyl-CoA dehydrogenase family protein [Pandoraea nosoerga]